MGKQRPLWILLAHDHGPLREELARALERDGAVVDAVATSATAIERVIEQRFRPDVVVSDVRRSRKPGLDVLTALRSAGLTTPVVLLTSPGEAIDTHGLDGLGGAILVEMPFDAPDLRALLRRVESKSVGDCRRSVGKDRRSRRRA